MSSSAINDLSIIAHGSVTGRKLRYAQMCSTLSCSENTGYHISQHRTVAYVLTTADYFLSSSCVLLCEGTVMVESFLLWANSALQISRDSFILKFLDSVDRLR